MSNNRDLADLGKSAEAIDVDASAPADSLNINASGNVGIDTTANTWPGSYAALEIGTSGTIYSRTDTQELIGITSNSYYDGTSNKYKIAGEAARMYFLDGWLNVDTASAGSAGGTVTYTSNLVLKGGGDLQFNSGYGSVATAYGCRAWVNFDGTDNSINGSGNVSSVTDSGAGLYYVNFTNAMPDTNFATSAIARYVNGTGVGTVVFVDNSPATTRTAQIAVCAINSNYSARDTTDVSVVVFR